MLKKPLVRINTATEQEIVQLHAIGPKLAKRIVVYRDSTSYFYGPQDLAKIVGISLDLAQTLDSQIDWRLPESQEDEEEKRHWSDWVAAACFLFISFYILRSLVGWVFSSLAALSEPEITGVRFWAAVVKFTAWDLLYLLAALCALGFSLTALVRSPRKKSRYRRLFFGVATLQIPVVIVAVLGEGIYYQFFAPGGWADLTRDHLRLFNVVWPLYAALLLGPLALVLWKSELARNRLLVRAYDYTIILGSLLFILTIGYILWSNVFSGQELILWLVFAGLLGLGNIFQALLVISGTSPLEFLDSSPEASEKSKASDRWRTWVQNNFPDPKQQEELKQALEEMHPTSKIRIFTGAILLTAGTWLLLQCVGAFLEWIVQGWLDSMWYPNGR